MIRNGKYVAHDQAGAVCLICRKRRNTVRSVQRHVKSTHTGEELEEFDARRAYDRAKASGERPVPLDFDAIERRRGLR